MYNVLGGAVMEKKNIVRTIATIYSIFYTIALICMIIYAIIMGSRADWVSLIIGFVFSTVNMILLWSLSGVIDRVNELEEILEKKEIITKRDRFDSKEDVKEESPTVMRTCKSCGYQIFPEDEKCRNCGEKVDKD